MVKAHKFIPDPRSIFDPHPGEGHSLPGGSISTKLSSNPEIPLHDYLSTKCVHFMITSCRYAV